MDYNIISYYWIQRVKDGIFFKMGDKIFSKSSGEYYISLISPSERHLSGICIQGFKEKDKHLIFENCSPVCGGDDLNMIEKIE